jgi:hypothetical protein
MAAIVHVEKINMQFSQGNKELLSTLNSLLIVSVKIILVSFRLTQLFMIHFYFYRAKTIKQMHLVSIMLACCSLDWTH